MLEISSDNILFSKTFIIGIAPATAASKQILTEFFFANSDIFHMNS